MTKPPVRRITHHVTRHRTVRFALVGVINTVVDFAILFGLVKLLGWSPLIANIVSTSVALTVSYLLNKHAVFRDTDMHNVRQITQFIATTLIGLWLIQGVVISAVTALLWVATSVGATVTLLIAKLAATAVSLMWNYTLYSQVVFRRDDE